MPAGPAAFDATLHETNRRLKSVMRGMHSEDRQRAYLALRTTLHPPRDRLGPERSIRLAAQVPTLPRGLCLEGRCLAASQSCESHQPNFLEHVRNERPKDNGIDINLAARTVFATLDEKLDPGEAMKVTSLLPAELEALRLRNCS